MLRGVVQKPYSIITDFCDGGSLYTYLHNTENYISQSDKYRWLREIASGMVSDMEV
jgi:hypothetical protein